ncbi:MAG: anthranilate synthase component I [Candidatus Omnitrophota bacterium]
MLYPDLKEFKRLSKKGNIIPIYRELSADIDTPVSCFLKIDNGKPSYLLESVEGGEKIARYSFLGTDPEVIIKSKGRSIEIISAKTGTRQKPSVRRFECKKDPLEEIRTLMKGYRFVAVKGLPRFCGGFVGYFGYDMVRFFERLPDTNTDDLRCPDSIFMLTDTILIFDHVDHTIKVVSNAHIAQGASPERVYRAAAAKIERLAAQLKKPLKRAAAEKPPVPSSLPAARSNMTQRQFEDMITRTKKYIRNGDIIQAVLSQRFEVDLGATAPFDIYRALRSLNQSPYMYYLDFKELKLVGSSPEIMVRCENGTVEVRPIAGTRPRGCDDREDARLSADLLKDVKERAEHIMLVDLGRNDIGRVCDYHTVKTPELMVVEKYSHVMHIVSDVSGRLSKGKDCFDVIRATFPAGTLSGAPKVRAMEIIEELENRRRGPYGGCIGYFSFSGNLDSCITIRTILIKKGKAYVQAGAGIVADSRPATEYRETQNKAKAPLLAIALARGSAR